MEAARMSTASLGLEQTTKAINSLSPTRERLHASRGGETRWALIPLGFVSALSMLRSTSMFDMRCEEEAAVQPHSRARQEQLQMINTQLREEDDKWQDVSAGRSRELLCSVISRYAGMQAGWEDLDLERKPLREFNMICFHLFGRRGCSPSWLG